MLIKPPINILTPPVSLLGKNKQNQSSASKPGTQSASASKPASSGGGSKPSGSGASSAAAQQPAYEIPSYESIFSEMLARYLPETVAFTPLSESEISRMIGNWLRPAYEQAISDRKLQTVRQNAELDADAWSRGMGTSTYVTDVKDRAFRDEAQDVGDLESDYAATLAGHLYDAMRAQQEQKLEVDRFNAEQINRANEQAVSAANALYSAYLSAAGQQTAPAKKSGSSGKQNAGAQSGSTIEALLNVPLNYELAEIGYDEAANLLARMTPPERAALYAGSDPDSARQKLEIISSLGSDVYNRLKAQFPA